MRISAKNILIHIGFWLLLPVSAIQGLWLRLRAIRLPEARGEKTGLCGNGEPLHLLAMGDSIIAGVGTGTVIRSMPVQFAHALADRERRRVHWRVDGANGADISDLQKQVEKLDQRLKADVLLISIGVNDVTGLTTKWDWKTRLISVTKNLRLKWPEAAIIFLGIPPMSRFPLPPQPLSFTLGLRAAVLDAISIDILTNQANMLHVPTEIDPDHPDFCEDGFHPSANACGFWAERLVEKFRSDTLSL